MGASTVFSGVNFPPIAIRDKFRGHATRFRRVKARAFRHNATPVNTDSSAR
jgi:hypothetical protein